MAPKGGRGAASTDDGGGATGDGVRKRGRASGPSDPEVYLARGDVQNYKRALLMYSRHTPGTAHWIDPVPVPSKKATGGRRGGGSSAAHGGTAWDLRELCRNLKPLAPWDNVEPHRSLKHLPALNIDLLANEDPPMRAEALSELVRLNRELPQFFRDNPLTSANGKNKDYKCVRG